MMAREDRAGFDYQGTAASGIEGNADKPAMPVTHAINDYVAGYLVAVGALAALIRRARVGGSYHVIVSLTRSAMWYPSLGIVDSSLFDSADEKHKLLPAV